MIPWWNDKCTEAIKEQSTNQESLINYQRKKALVCRIIKNSKQNAWRNYYSIIRREIERGDVWSMLKKINGKKVYKRKHIRKEL